MIDMVKDLVAFVKADPEIAAVVGTRVYGYKIPEAASAVPPLCLITVATSTRGTRPQTAWWNYLAALDFHTNEDPATSLALATRMQEIAPTFVGTHSTGVVADSQVDSVQPVADDGWTPTRFRQVVTVALTAREP